LIGCNALALLRPLLMRLFDWPGCLPAVVDRWQAGFWPI